jgi:hypothetical protein
MVTRDRIVAGIGLAERLPGLTPEKAVTQTRQSEAIKKSIVRKGSHLIVGSWFKLTNRYDQAKQPGPAYYRCGRSPPPATVSSISDKFHKKGHCQSVCRPKRPGHVHSVEAAVK